MAPTHGPIQVKPWPRIDTLETQLAVQVCRSMIFQGTDKPHLRSAIMEREESRTYNQWLLEGEQKSATFRNMEMTAGDGIK